MRALQPHRRPFMPRKPPTSRPMGGRNASNPWGSNKVQRTLSVTDEAWNQWTKAADDADINRSEMFEVLARMAHLLGVYELRTRLLSERKK